MAFPALGSHHKLVPVKPRCPNVSELAALPAEEAPSDLPSKPARKLPPGLGLTSCSSVARDSQLLSPDSAESSAEPKRSTSLALPNKPA